MSKSILDRLKTLEAQNSGKEQLAWVKEVLLRVHEAVTNHSRDDKIVTVEVPEQPKG